MNFTEGGSGFQFRRTTYLVVDWLCDVSGDHSALQNFYKDKMRKRTCTRCDLEHISIVVALKGPVVTELTTIIYATPHA